MMKVSTAQGKLDRIDEQMNLAHGEIDTINGERQQLDTELTTILGKITPDQAKVDALESRRLELHTSKTGLEARIEALQGTLPGAVTVLNQAELDQTMKDRAVAVEVLHDLVKAWRAKVTALTELQAIAAGIRQERAKLSEIESHARYLSALLNSSEINPLTTDHLTREDITPLREGLHRASDTELDPYSVNVWNEKLNKLNDAKREAERAIVREKRHAETVSAGW